MPASIITPEDLESFKRELLSEIQKLIASGQQTSKRRWLKSNEVRRMLLISPGTLQNLRLKGSLPFTKIGGVLFYDHDDIQRMLEDNKQCRRPPYRQVKSNLNHK